MTFGEGPKAHGTWAGRRLLMVDEQPAFELSFWCGTCQFLFERLEGSNQTLSGELEDELNAGLTEVDPEVLSAFGSLLEEGRYLPILLDVEPRLVRPSEAGDYFASEQVSTWGLEPFWDLPVHPRTPYYRTFSTAVDAEAHMYEFIVPMVPPSWNERERVEGYESTLAMTSRPMAVAVSTLDVCVPATDVQGSDYHAHWGLTHFLLDGHHKVEAAARGGNKLRLLSLLAIEASLATENQVLGVPELRTRPERQR